MEKIMQKPELLAPAGSLQKLKTAILYGADAVYMAGERYGLRKNAQNFTADSLKEGVEFAHARGKKVYAAVNIFALNADFDGFLEYVKTAHAIGVDAFIVSDPGFFSIIRKNVPDAELHISTQANVTNYESANFWHEQGARRVILARELTLSEIAEIRAKTPKTLDIECFVHGAMCLSYSGRCYLSQYLSGRDGNGGDCSQPCRWEYTLLDNARHGHALTVSEDDKGAYILNSNDMCMIEHIDKLMDAGITSFKIEGRMKTEFYVAQITKAYRRAIDDCVRDIDGYRANVGSYRIDAEKVSHREYFSGFYFGKDSKSQNTGSTSYTRTHDYKAIVTEYDGSTGIATVAQRGKFSRGDTLEVLTQKGDGFSFIVEEMFDEGGKPIDSAPHAEQVVKIKVRQDVSVYDLISCEIENVGE